MNSQQICLLLRSLYKSMDLHEITACFLLIYWDNLTAFLEVSANLLITTIPIQFHGSSWISNEFAYYYDPYTIS